ncbi:MAG TPA: hypothetical protein DEP24_05065 [Mycobacterium sp.]|nr:hypothetical protein [Mycobacterium sp.]
MALLAGAIRRIGIGGIASGVRGTTSGSTTGGRTTGCGTTTGGSTTGRSAGLRRTTGRSAGCGATQSRRDLLSRPLNRVAHRALGGPGRSLGHRLRHRSRRALDRRRGVGGCLGALGCAGVRLREVAGRGCLDVGDRCLGPGRRRPGPVPGRSSLG